MKRRSLRFSADNDNCFKTRVFEAKQRIQLYCWCMAGGTEARYKHSQRFRREISNCHRRNGSATLLFFILNGNNLGWCCVSREPTALLLRPVRSSSLIFFIYYRWYDQMLLMVSSGDNNRKKDRLLSSTRRTTRKAQPDVLPGDAALSIIEAGDARPALQKARFSSLLTNYSSPSISWHTEEAQRQRRASNRKPA